jgi:hypothetical protein
LYTSQVSLTQFRVQRKRGRPKEVSSQPLVDKKSNMSREETTKKILKFIWIVLQVICWLFIFIVNPIFVIVIGVIYLLLNIIKNRR